MIKHVVFFKFKASVADADIVNLEERLGALPGIIDDIKQYEFGRDIVRSERSYDFALVSAFADLAALQRYQTHPEHVKVVAVIKAMCDGVLAVDFNSEP